MANIIRRTVSKLSANDIIPCGKYPVCLCVEYLNFSNKNDMTTYKNCYCTYENNLKYKKKLKENGLPTCEVDQLWYNYNYDIKKILEYYQSK